MHSVINYNEYRWTSNSIKQNSVWYNLMVKSHFSYAQLKKKMYYLQFRTKNCTDITLDINYFNKSIATCTYTMFLDWVTYDTLTRDNHVDHLISRLNSTCYAITAVIAMLSRKALRMLYFSYVHSITYGIIFGESYP